MQVVRGISPRNQGSNEKGEWDFITLSVANNEDPDYIGEKNVPIKVKAGKVRFIGFIDLKELLNREVALGYDIKVNNMGQMVATLKSISLVSDKVYDKVLPPFGVGADK